MRRGGCKKPFPSSRDKRLPLGYNFPLAVHDRVRLRGNAAYLPRRRMIRRAQRPLRFLYATTRAFRACTLYTLYARVTRLTRTYAFHRKTRPRQTKRSQQTVRAGAPSRGGEKKSKSFSEPKFNRIFAIAPVSGFARN